MPASPAIHAENLGFDYGEDWRLEDVSFRLDRGQALGLVGPNGAGKSTLINLMATVLRPRSGRLEILGGDAVRDRRRIRPRIALVPQTGGLDDGLSVRTNLILGGLLQGPPLRVVRQRAAELLELFGLTEQAKVNVGRLSGGQHRRTLLARAFMGEPELLFLDEPTAGLDPQMRRAFHAFLSELCRTAELTFVLCSHDLREVEGLCDELAVVQNGRLVTRTSMDALVASLDGRWMRVRFAGPAPDLRAVRALPEVLDIRFGGDGEIWIRLDDDGAALNSVLTAVASCGDVTSLSLEHSPHLEDCLFHLTAGEARA